MYAWKALHGGVETESLSVPPRWVLSSRNPSTGLWRAVKITDGVLRPPTEDGWGTTPYVVVRKPEQKAEAGQQQDTGKESSTGGGDCGITGFALVYWHELTTSSANVALGKLVIPEIHFSLYLRLNSGLQSN